MMYQVGEKIFIKPFMKDDTVGINYYLIITEADPISNEYKIDYYNYRTDQKEWPKLSDWSRPPKTIPEAKLIDLLTRKIFFLSEKELLETIITRHKTKMDQKQQELNDWKARVNKRIKKMEDKINTLP